MQLLKGMSITLTLTEPQFMKEELNEDSRPSIGRGKVNGDQDEEDAREAELIVFENTTQGLGLKICGGCSPDGTENFGIFVKRVLPGGLAATSGDIFSGDLILEVNGQSMQGVSYDRAVTMLRQASASNYVELVVARDADAQNEFSQYMNRFGTPQSPLTVRNFVNCDQPKDSDADYQRKMEITLKDSELDAYRPGEQHGLLQGKYSEINGHISPSSSGAGEVASHMEDLAGSSQAKKSLNNGISANKNVSPDYLDALLSKRLSQDPGSKLHIDQLESAIVSLGLQLSPTTQMTLRESLNIDLNGLVKFEDFVEAAKGIFQNELAALRRTLSPKPLHEHMQQNNNSPLEEYTSVVSERDQLRAEVAALKEELRNRNQSSKNVEEQLLFVRKHAQASIEEVRSLKSKLHLSEQAQTKAQQTERDYEEVVAMLENEVSQLRLQLSKSDGVHMHKRLAVLVCQLKKAESGKKTYEVATEKLIRYIEHSQEVLASLENSSRTTGSDGASSKVNKKRTLHQLSAEGADMIKTVRSLMETVSLPFGWEEAYTTDGVKYYINHLNQTTTWTHPVSCMEHHTAAKTGLKSTHEQQQQQQSHQQQQQSHQQQPQLQEQPSLSGQTKLKHPPPTHRATYSKQHPEQQSKESKQQKDYIPPEESKQQKDILPEKSKQAQAAV